MEEVVIRKGQFVDSVQGPKRVLVEEGGEVGSVSGAYSVIIEGAVGTLSCCSRVKIAGTAKMAASCDIEDLSGEVEEVLGSRVALLRGSVGSMADCFMQNADGAIEWLSDCFVGSLKGTVSHAERSRISRVEKGGVVTCLDEEAAVGVVADGGTVEHLCYGASVALCEEGGTIRQALAGGQAKIRARECVEKICKGARVSLWGQLLSPTASHDFITEDGSLIGYVSNYDRWRLGEASVHIASCPTEVEDWRRCGFHKVAVPVPDEVGFEVYSRDARLI